MDYRNDREALRGRVEELEQELVEARRGESVARLEAELMEAEGLMRRFRDQLAAVQEARTRGERVEGTEMLEAEVVRAEALISGFRRVLHEMERAPAAAELLIARLRSDLAELDHARVHRVEPSENAKPGRRAKAVVATALSVLVAALIGLWIASRHDARIRAVCDETGECCRTRTLALCSAIARMGIPGSEECWVKRARTCDRVEMNTEACEGQLAWYRDHGDCEWVVPIPDDVASFSQRER